MNTPRTRMPLSSIHAFVLLDPYHDLVNKKRNDRDLNDIGQMHLRKISAFYISVDEFGDSLPPCLHFPSLLVVLVTVQTEFFLQPLCQQQLIYVVARAPVMEPVTEPAFAWGAFLRPPFFFPASGLFCSASSSVFPSSSGPLSCGSALCR